MSLDILVVPTYNMLTLGVVDASTYTTPPTTPTIEITIPGFGVTAVSFAPGEVNLFNSMNIGLTAVGEDLLPIPDGLYTLKYYPSIPVTSYVEKTIMRVDQLQEKFDNAFMKLDIMECDGAIRKQQKVNLNSIYYFIQGSVAAANNCAVDVSNRLYQQASKMLNTFIHNNCGCSGNNYPNPVHY
jgi:hypothetical protein